MSQGHAELFGKLRGDAMQRLVQERASISHGYANIPDEVIARQFDMVLDKMQIYLANGELEVYRGFAARWLAMRVAGRVTPENLIHTVVAIGDVVAKVARERLGHGAEYQEFSLAVARMTFVAARLLVEVLATDLAEGQRHLREMGA